MANGCQRCGGLRWCDHKPGAGERAHPIPERIRVGQLGEDLTPDEELELAQIRRRQVEYEESMYPCPDCNLILFLRWQDGHLDSDHDRAGCEDPACQATKPHRSRTRT